MKTLEKTTLDEKTRKILEKMAKETPEEAEEARRPENILDRFRWWMEDLGYAFHPPFHEGGKNWFMNSPAYAEKMQGPNRKAIYLFQGEEGSYIQANVTGHNGQSHSVSFPLIVTPDGKTIECRGECGWVFDGSDATSDPRYHGIVTYPLKNQHQIAGALCQLEGKIQKAIERTDGFCLRSGY